MMSLETWTRRYVAPVAKEAGLTRKGLLYRLAHENGDHALLEFRPRHLDPAMEVFTVKAFVVPATSWAWSYRKSWESARKKAPDASAALVQWSVTPPENVAFTPHAVGPLDADWAYGAGVDPDTAGRAVAEVLREVTLPAMRRLLDREQLWAEICRPGFAFHRGRPPGWARMLLHVDEASPAELEELASQVETDYPVADEFIAWARARAAGHLG
ncbi:hypothetical protein [Streptomyces sp. CBMA123]|uniref:hypothetical protein n=1 Tax=Streptomyces sp. CBMA123 TaxID=1896313 RepID=UPI001661EBB7|nr:hypothetical protein [Streptomyces sp. CBMA123]MBD0689016.1 hypothetical protein [Streptomyces sp. CBMA123]